MLATEAETYARSALETRVLPVAGDAFLGAYIMGSLASKEPEEEFNHRASDIDLGVAVRGDVIDHERYPHGKFVVSGPCLVQIIYAPEIWDDRERLLTTLGLGSNLRAGRLLADPEGILEAAKRVIAAEWADPEWVSARTTRAVEFAGGAVTQLGKAATDLDRVAAVIDLVTQLSGLAAIAHAATPTHRKSLVLARRLMEPHTSIIERMIFAAGARDVSAADIEQAVDDVRAATAIDTSIPQAMLDPEAVALLPDHAAAGVREVADLGFAADALINAAGAVAISAMVLGEIGSDSDRESIAPLVARRARSLGIDESSWNHRVSDLEAIAEEMFEYAVSTAG